MGVDVETNPALLADGMPDPIKMKRVPAKMMSAIPLKNNPRGDGRNLNTKRVRRPRILASIK